MKKEIIETGKTVDAAIESACAKLGQDRDKCEWEIIDLPKRSFLGLKMIPAKVRVTVDIPDEKPVMAVVPKVESRPVPRKETKPELVKEQKKDQSINISSAETPVKEYCKKEERRPQFTQEKKIIDGDIEQEPRIPVFEGFTEKEIVVVQYISSILTDFGLSAKLKVFREGNGICIDIAGEGMGTIIGRRGETLDAIQYLSGLVANRLDGDYLRVTVDCGDYRAKRKSTLEALAKKLAAHVIKTNTSKILEPMNPFERRVIHATVSKIEGVSSSSIGEEPNRRVVITSPTARRPVSRGYGRDESRDGNHSVDRRSRPSGGRDHAVRSGGDRRRASRNLRQAPVQSGPPKETPESATMGGTPIGKLDFE